MVADRGLTSPGETVSFLSRYASPHPPSSSSPSSRDERVGGRFRPAIAARKPESGKSPPARDAQAGFFAFGLNVKRERCGNERSSETRFCKDGWPVACNCAGRSERRSADGGFS